ncbi:MAG: endonuclease V [Promethearchaeota archaeon]
MKNAQDVRIIDLISNYNVIGIIKIRFEDEYAYSGNLIFDMKQKKTLDIKFHRFKPKFTEYFPSVLFLNQTDIYLNSIKDSNISPDCYIVNSSGQIHPYLYGCACDFGLKANVPVIGYTKKLLYGDLKLCEKNPDIKGVYYQGTLIGYAIPKPNSKKFIYISVGNNISLESALKTVLKLDFNLFSRLKTELSNYIQSKKKQ